MGIANSDSSADEINEKKLILTKPYLGVAYVPIANPGVKDFVNISAKKIGFKIKWINKGLKEEAIDEITNKKIINVSKKYFRETEVDNLIGDFTKAKKILKWKPKYSLNQLIDDMIKNEK